MNFSDPCSLAAPGGEIWIKYSCDGPQKPIETTIDEGNIQGVSIILSTDIDLFQVRQEPGPRQPPGLPGHTPSLPHGPLGPTPRIQPGTL